MTEISVRAPAALVRPRPCAPQPPDAAAPALHTRLSPPVPRFRYTGDGDLDDVATPPPPRRPRPVRREPDVYVDARLAAGGSLSTYSDATHGPAPTPSWVVTSGGAIDTDHGPLKTGKEADVHLVERRDPDTGATSLLAAKRSRDADHRLFHRDAGYLEGRRVGKSRETRAMAHRTGIGAGADRPAVGGHGARRARPPVDRRHPSPVPGAARRQ